MIEKIHQPIPEHYTQIEQATIESGFTMASDMLTCGLLRTLAASKPAGKFLELGTGTGLSTCWILDGMDIESTLISFDNDETVLKIAKTYLGTDKRLTLLQSDGEEWIRSNKGQKFDFIFADTWHGKYLLLNEVLDMIKIGGLYILDDMLPQPNWPEGHGEKVAHLINYLESRSDLFVTKQVWATGIIIVVKR